MTDHDTTAGSPAQESAASRDDWADVKRSLDELGAALTKWASAVKDDPENRRHAAQIKEQFESMGKDMGKIIDSATDSGFVKDMGSAAGKAGEAVTDAAHTLGREVRPFMAAAFRTAAEGMRVVAEKVDDSAARKTAAAPAPAAPEPPPAPSHPHPAPQPAPYSGTVEPPGPAPSGVHTEPHEPDPGEH